MSWAVNFTSVKILPQLQAPFTGNNLMAKAGEQQSSPLPLLTSINNLIKTLNLIFFLFLSFPGQFRAGREKGKTVF